MAGQKILQIHLNQCVGNADIDVCFYEPNDTFYDYNETGWCKS